MNAGTIGGYEFAWAEESVEMKEFFDDYSGILPVIARVVEGYEGVDVTLSFSSDEVFWIFGIREQKKIIAKEQMGRYLSIPLESHFRFQRVTKNSSNEQIVGPPVCFDSILQEPGGGHDTKFIFEKNQEVSFLREPDDEKSTQFGTMEYVDIYEENNFLVHPIFDMNTLEVHPCVHHMPVYVPIKLQVATGFIGRDQREYDRWMDSVIEEKTKEGFFDMKETYKFPAKILVYDECPETSPDYEYIRPRSVICASYLGLCELESSESQPETEERSLHLEVVSGIGPPLLPPRNIRPKNSVESDYDVNLRGSNRCVSGSHPANYANSGMQKMETVVNDDNSVQYHLSRPHLKLSSKYKYDQVFGSMSLIVFQKDRLTTPIKYDKVDWKALSDVPRNMEQLSVDEVARCLELLRISPNKVDKFRDQEVDGSLLLCLDEMMFIDDFGLTRFEARKLMKFAKEGWRPYHSGYKEMYV